MTATNNLNPIDWLSKHLQSGNSDPVRAMLHRFVELLMGAEADAMCNAEYGKRDEERTNQRNGYRHREWDTRTGTIDLAIPKLRKGTYFPDWLLEPRRRSEKALWVAIATAYLVGVSTRRVDKFAKALGMKGISKSQVSRIAGQLDEDVKAFRERTLTSRYPYVWLDAISIKTRENKHVVSVAVVVAIGVRDDGHREVLGLDIITEESGPGWSDFLRGLVERGLTGVKLVISDAHSGLKTAIFSELSGASWQRCRTHFMRNVLTKVPKSSQAFVASIIRTVFAQADVESVEAQYGRVCETLSKNFPKVVEMLEDAQEEVLAFRHFPTCHWRKIWSNNPLERLNKEIRRRTNVVGIFPNRDAVIRLVGALLAEQNDEWVEARRYMTIGSLSQLDAAQDDKDEVAALPNAPPELEDAA